MSEQSLLDRQQAAELLGVCTRTLERWARLDVGPKPVRYGLRKVRYRRRDVVAYLAEGEPLESAA